MIIRSYSRLRKPRKFLSALALTGSLFLPMKLYSEDIHIPRDYSTIQAGIDAARDRDRVLVAPGEYVIDVPITYRGKAITVKSQAGPERTYITMEDPKDPSNASVILFNNNETNDTILEGFTIRGGKGTKKSEQDNLNIGGGILIWRGSPTITRNHIKENYAEHGGGMALGYSHAMITDNIISNNNTGPGNGGGILLYYSSPFLTRNQFLENKTMSNGGGIACTNDSNPVMKDCLFADNSADCGGGAVFFIDESDPEIVNCTMYKNSAGCEGGGAFYIYPFGNPSTPRIINTISWENSPNEVFNIPISSFQYCVIDDCEFIRSPKNQGNICLNPLFKNPERGEFCLLGNSPCIDSGHPDPIYNDPDGTRADIGAYSWCEKARFIRGDVAKNGRVDIADPIFILDSLFGDGKIPTCMDAADANDDGTVNIADPVFLLNYLYLEGPQPPSPFPKKGYDPTEDELSCLR